MNTTIMFGRYKSLRLLVRFKEYISNLKAAKTKQMSETNPQMSIEILCSNKRNESTVKTNNEYSIPVYPKIKENNNIETELVTIK
ncbi:MAG: hypothetical protein IPP29_16375 [Bacteroidetes bacterium]|nr:hypothetical protein [Bacteroidota bacterium]